MKKKIIFVTKALWIGGIETALVNLLKYFNYDKYDVTLLVLKAELDMLDQIHPKCHILIADREQMVSFQEPYKYKRLYHLTEEPDQPSGFHKIMMWSVPVIRWIENRFYIRYIRKMMRQEKYDTAVIYSDVAGETAVRAIKADKYLMFYHHGAMRHVYHDRVAYKKCEKIITVSANQAEKLRHFVPRYAQKVIVLPNLTDVDGVKRKGQLLSEEVFDTEKFNIVSVGRIAYEKGMDFAVSVCAKLVNAGFRNIQWWIVGDGPEMNNLKKQIQSLNMEEYINLVGMKQNPYPYIKQADLYVQPSRVESFGLTIAETLILGKPVLATNTDGAQAMLVDGQTGILCDIGEMDLFKNCCEILQDRSIINKIEKNLQLYNYKDENRKKIKELEKLL